MPLLRGEEADKNHFDKENIPNNQRANKSETNEAFYGLVQSLRTHEKRREEKSKCAKRGFLMLIPEVGAGAGAGKLTEPGKSVLFVV